MNVITSIRFNKDYFKVLAEEEAMALRRCWVCGKVKPVSEFYRDGSRSGGYDNKCKDCTRKLKEKRRLNGSRRNN